jgi:hypothetical protein
MCSDGSFCEEVCERAFDCGNNTPSCAVDLALATTALLFSLCVLVNVHWRVPFCTRPIFTRSAYFCASLAQSLRYESWGSRRFVRRVLSFR